MDTWIDLPAAVIVFALGASIGSFLNVVVYRLPNNLSILWPPSRCPQCMHRLEKRDNVPVLGWLFLRGRCRHCRTKISSRYPLVEAASGVLFLMVFWAFGYSLATIGYWFFFSWLLTLSLIDLDTMTLPGVLTKSGLIAGLVYQAAAGAGAPASIAHHLMSGIVGAVVGIWVFDTIRVLGSIIFRKEAMGDGDAYLAAMMGAWLGWKYLLLAGFLACVVGAFGGGGAIALGWLERRFPFGPCLAIGAVLATFWGEAILEAYLGLFFPLTQ
ncbi:prepilin peptidase [Microcoleus sp. FACHB-831]|jgi:leader peptidase (prepilin peptidase)/N-methyltransferase|uniref:prepilin peptidase n=1 Tax=Microcoleus sp. FACHB-831 TaxID=2692827 RepID=UPI0016880280|nr:A24 family peptidase [Microcoleus sp. FACHB-831]MBD1924350.1 prepilin peptidase [Microcoleus sp. FACHB-831]